MIIMIRVKVRIVENLPIGNWTASLESGTCHLGLWGSCHGLVSMNVLREAYHV